MLYNFGVYWFATEKNKVVGFVIEEITTTI